MCIKKRLVMKQKTLKRAVDLNIAVDLLTKARKQLHKAYICPYDFGYVSSKEEGEFIDAQSAIEWYTDCLILAVKDKRIFTH